MKKQLLILGGALAAGYVLTLFGFVAGNRGQSCGPIGDIADCVKLKGWPTGSFGIDLVVWSVVSLIVLMLVLKKKS